MFLNALVKHADHPVVLGRQLRRALRIPAGVDVAAAELAELVTSIAPPSLALDAERAAARPHNSAPVTPTHAVFFATMCWHLQAADRWPAFQPSSRHVMQDEEELFAPTGDPVRDYFQFREAFLSLAAALALDTWQLEHVCWWHARRSPSARGDVWSDDGLAYMDSARPRPLGQPARGSRRSAGRRLTPVDPSPRTTVPLRTSARNDKLVREPMPAYMPFGETPVLDHTHVQWVLAKVGQQLGCRVWIAANDWRREWGGERLGSLSVPALPPLGLSPDSQRVVSLIDVVWLTGVNQVAAAFEVEHTTSVYSGLLRMADLAALSPNLNFPLPGLTRWPTGPEAIEKLADVAAPEP